MLPFSAESMCRSNKDVSSVLDYLLTERKKSNLKYSEIPQYPQIQPSVFALIRYMQITVQLILHLTFEPPHDKTNKMACVPSQDSDQPAWASAQSDQSLRCPH